MRISARLALWAGLVLAGCGAPAPAPPPPGEAKGAAPASAPPQARAAMDAQRRGFEATKR